MPVPKLSIELVPKSAWGRNLRQLLSTDDWDILRKRQYALAGGVCEICGESGKDQGFREALHCHEVWDYDEGTGIQKLVRLIALCPICHDVKHFGFSTTGKGPEAAARAFAKLLKVNGWTKVQAEAHLGEMFNQFVTRSNQEWELDVSWLGTCGASLSAFKVKKPRKSRRKRK